MNSLCTGSGAQELCESQGGHPGLHVPNTRSVDVQSLWMYSLCGCTVSVHVKQH